MRPSFGVSTAANAFGDAELVRQALSGHTSAFSDLVRRYQAALYRHAVAMVLDHDAAADLVQDAFVRAFVNLGRCRDHDRFNAWLFQTLRNRCLDFLKEARRRDVRLDDAPALVDRHEQPDERLDGLRLRAKIRTALLGLPIAQREAFVLRVVEGLPYETIAGLVEASESAVKMRVLRAREALASALEDRNVTDERSARLCMKGR